MTQPTPGSPSPGSPAPESANLAATLPAEALPSALTAPGPLADALWQAAAGRPSLVEAALIEAHAILELERRLPGVQELLDWVRARARPLANDNTPPRQR